MRGDSCNYITILKLLDRISYLCIYSTINFFPDKISISIQLYYQKICVCLIG